MTAVWTASGTNAGALDRGFSSAAFTFTGVTLGVGDIYVFVGFEGSGIAPPSAVKIDGVSATQVGSTLFSGTAVCFSVWTAACVHATGDIVVTPGGGVDTTACNWGVATGEGVPIVTTFTSAGTANPQGPVTGTILANGVGVFSIFSTFGNGAIPAAWNNATALTSMEAGVATSNQGGCSGAFSTAAGAASVTVTWTQFAAETMFMLAFPASGGGPSSLPSGLPRLIMLNVGDQ